MTPCHDPNDYEVGLRHNLEQIQCIDEDAKIINGGKYNGMDRYDARKAIVADLEEQGYLVKVEPYSHNVGTCYRCGTVVEPLISPQWFVKMKPLAKAAIEVVKDGRIKFVPERFTKIYLTRLVHLPPALVGPPDPRLVLRRLRPHHRLPRGRLRMRKVPQQKDPPRGGRAGHLVLLGPLALLHDGLAGEDRRPRLLVSHLRHGHGL